jgi:hypothetical protein
MLSLRPSTPASMTIRAAAGKSAGTCNLSATSTTHGRTVSGSSWGSKRETAAKLPDSGRGRDQGSAGARKAVVLRGWRAMARMPFTVSPGWPSRERTCGAGPRRLTRTRAYPRCAGPIAPAGADSKAWSDPSTSSLQASPILHALPLFHKVSRAAGLHGHFWRAEAGHSSRAPKPFEDRPFMRRGIV